MKKHSCSQVEDRDGSNRNDPPSSSTYIDKDHSEDLNPLLMFKRSVEYLANNKKLKRQEED